jgi:hypothetical protein
MDHEQVLILEFDCHHLQRHTLCVVAEIDEPLLGLAWAAADGSCSKTRPQCSMT